MKKLSRRDLLKIGAGAVGGVVVILLDALRADHVGCYGYRRKNAHGELVSATPNIDQFAREGTTFTRAYASSSVTIMSMFSLHTGYERPTFDPLYEGRFSSYFPTFPEVFRDNGWRAKTFSANALHWMCSWNTRGYDKGDIHIPFRYLDKHNRWQPWWKAEVALIQVREKLFARLEEPFMWYIHVMPPHEPYDPSERFWDVFDDGYRGKLPEEVYREYGEDNRQIPVNARVRDNLEKLTPRDMEHVVALYDANLYSADWLVGKIIGQLEWLGILENTVVVVTSDHGEEFTDHGGVGHDGTVYEEDTHVPLVFRYPKRVMGGEKVSDLVSMVDIPATILDLAGIQDELGVGRSLAIPLSRKFHAPHRERVYSDCQGVALKEGRWKFIAYDWLVGDSTGKGMLRRNQGRKPPELYDLSVDPGETKNIVSEHPELAASFEEDVKRWVESGTEIWLEKVPELGGPSNPKEVPVWNDALMRAMHDELMAKRDGGDGIDKYLELDKRLEEEDYGLPKEQLERLKALGYIGG